jgi:signal transduction histidine kinase/CheY-like chemotaxis protein
VSLPILSLEIRYERDTVSARQRARQIARLLGFDAQDQTRISTAVSEIARNALNYAGGGRVEYSLEGVTAPQLFIIKISDVGQGIADLKIIMEGRYHSKTGMGLGIIGARRLMDQFEINATPGAGTTVWLKKLLPKRASLVRVTDLSKISSELLRESPQDAFQELQHQNQELLTALEEIRMRQLELTRLNRELEDTNRGVVALYAELDEKADHLRRADELKSRFLSDMSHEFRSPLNSILALSGLLMSRSDGDLTDEQAQQVGYVRKAAQDLLELVNDLLDLAKVEAGKVEAKPIEFEAANLFAALRGMLRPLLLNQSVDLVFDEVEHMPVLYTDEGKLSQILRNFISNALKFTERGEIRVSAWQSGKGEASFSVSDQGIGIEPENLERIFQEFTQIDHPIQKRVKGTGLGLPLSKKLANLLGGRINVQSKPGVGSTFIVSLPLRYADDQVSPAPKARIEAAGDLSLIPVLILEDSPEMMTMYKGYLKGSGFQIYAANTTRDARDILERIQPAVVVVDVRLRSEDSWEFMAEVKRNFSQLPVMVVSTIEDQAKAFHLGINAYIVKPLEQPELIRLLRELTGQPPLDQVLIIDDEERDRYILRQKLKNLPYQVFEAQCGTDGIRDACKLKPAAIFLDLKMPDLTGAEVLDRLNKEPAAANIPVIIVTSQALREAERSELLRSAAAVIDKQSLENIDFSDFIGRLTR